MTHEQILQALEHCPDHEGCAECECQDFCSDLGELCGYASATIRKQAKDIESMLQRERGLVAELNRQKVEMEKVKRGGAEDEM